MRAVPTEKMSQKKLMGLCHGSSASHAATALSFFLMG